MQLNMFTRGHISQSLSRLQKLGYVTMEQDMNDRRCTHNHLTEKAGLVIRIIEKNSRKIKETIMEGVTEEEEKAFLSGAAKIISNIEKAL